MMEKHDGLFGETNVGGNGEAGGSGPADPSRDGSRLGLIPLWIAAALFTLMALYLYAHPERAGVFESRIRALRVTRPLSPEDSPVLAAQGIAGNNPLADPFSAGTGDCGLSLSLDTGIRVFIDGEYIGTTPIAGTMRLTRGKHLVELRRAGFADWSGEVDLRPGATLDLSAALIPL